MDSELRYLLSGLRASWLVFVAMMLLYAAHSRSVFCVVATGLPLLVGCSTLFLRRFRAQVGESWREAFASISARVAAPILVAMIILVSAVFSPLAGFLVGAWLGATGLVFAAAGRPESLRSLTQGFALTLVSTALVLGGLELVFRHPSVSGKFGLPSEEARWKNIYDGLEERNVFHIRSPYERTARRPNSYRVVAVGDSFTWGTHIASTNETWPAQFERRLRSKGGPEVEVVNISQTGYTTVNEAEAMDRIGWQFDPDLVVIQWLANDVLQSWPGFKRVLFQTPPRSFLPGRFNAGLARSSDLFAFVNAKYAALFFQDYRTEYPALYVDSNPDWRASVTAFRQIGEEARSRGVPVVVMIWPMIVDEVFTAETHPHRGIHDQVSAVARASGMHVLDLTPVFAAQGTDGYRWWATPWDRHPNALANALVARALDDYLTAEGIGLSNVFRPGPGSSLRSGH